MRLLKTLALAFLVANIGLWFGADLLRPQGSADAGSGRLPRVSDLQVAGPAEPVSTDSSASGQASGPPFNPVLASRDEVADDEPEPGADVSSGAQADQVPPLCLQVGWFDTPEQALAAREDQERIPATAEVVEISRPLPSFHWVLLPPAESRAAAYERFQEVRARGIDAYLVTEGPQENAISLGLFESRRAAENVLSQRQSQGLEAILASFPRNQIRYALFFEATAKGPENRDLAALERLESEFESVVKSRCEGVATPQKNP